MKVTLPYKPSGNLLFKVFNKRSVKPLPSYFFVAYLKNGKYHKLEVKQ